MARGGRANRRRIQHQTGRNGNMAIKGQRGGIRIIGRFDSAKPVVWVESIVPSCSQCNVQMRPIKGKQGMFYGCSRYPHCKQTQPFYDTT